MLAFTATSCLDKFPEDAVEEHKAITNIDQADEAIIGIYSSFLNGALYSGHLTLLPDLQTDLVYAVNGYSNQYGDIWRWNILPTNPEIEAVYAGLYAVIGNCNYFLENADKLEKTLTVESELEYLDRLRGEAIFARALAYSELIKLYCVDYKSDEEAKKEHGVVITTSYYEKPNLTRRTLYESYQFVIGELDRAAKYLDIDEEDYDVDTDGELFNAAGYFNEYTVYALRARIALYMRDWEAAIEYSSKIINSGYYALASATDEAVSGVSYYQYMWEVDKAYEIIWRVDFTTTNYGGSLGSIFWNYDFSNYYPDYVPATWVLNLYDGSDLRDDICFYNVQTGHTHGLTWPLLYKYFGNSDLLNSAQLVHKSMPKVFRLSEQYLIRAEAYCQKETPEYSKAGKDIAALRSKRYANFGGGVAMNEKNAMEIVEEERVKELYMEGFRLQDLKRWGKGFERTPQEQSLSNGSKLKIEKDNPLFVWPIPQHELDSPGADIQPNKSNI